MKEEAGKIMVGLYGNQSVEEGDDGVLILMSALKEEGVVAKPRDGKGSLPCIPQVVLDSKVRSYAKQSNKLENGINNENGGVGVYSASLKKQYILENDEWKEDDTPEIMDGHNFSDFIDPDILQILEDLEKEEGLRMAA
ncbi:hypothetical protein KI387_013709 [Taxus chinensis]|uniref:NOG C-terminal domain-containing protein n=1 Tax=Taxus chinensis TaxID=29808 RepID=A0AA38FHM7_TAXCH|nr:hypothetical protein KI387_013709 [Taxus chinensis]